MLLIVMETRATVRTELLGNFISGVLKHFVNEDLFPYSNALNDLFNSILSNVLQSKVICLSFWCLLAKL